MHAVIGQNPMFYQSIKQKKCVLFFFFVTLVLYMEEMLYEVRCLKSNENMILALAGQFKQLSHEPEKFR